MTDAEPRFESVDLSGATLHYSGSVGSTVWAAVPGVADKFISEIFVHCPVDQATANRLFISFNGGSKQVTLTPGGHFSWTPKGYKKQFHIKGNASSGVLYEILVNFETDG